MNFRPDIDSSGKQVINSTEELRGVKRLLLLFYWFAGARWSTLALVPASERERIAVLGSSVLVPTLMAFFGMYLYASSQFHELRPVLAFIVAVIWAFVIMNIDRILMATYRPFQPWFRKFWQVCFRFGLAAVISVAIAFPFCLEQYRGAIKERLRGEFGLLLGKMRVEEQTQRQELEANNSNLRKDLSEQLRDLIVAGPLEPDLYAEELARKDIRQQDEEVQRRKRQLEEEKNAASEKWKEASSRVRELEQDRASEAKGTLSPERGGTGRPHKGPKYDELTRDLNQAQRVEETARRRVEQLQDLTISQHPSNSGREESSFVVNDKLAAYLREGEERKAQIEKLQEDIENARKDHAERLDQHSSHYKPLIGGYEAKMKGTFDPMEETIGLFKVIFIPEPGSDAGGATAQQYKWMAALFQFSIVFGTLFLLDLIAILSKVISRPGPYDVLVEFTERVSRQNLTSFLKEYPRFADNWAEAATTFIVANGTGIDLRDAEIVARLLLCAHLPEPMEARAKVYSHGSSSYNDSPEGVA